VQKYTLLKWWERVTFVEDRIVTVIKYHYVHHLKNGLHNETSPSIQGMFGNRGLMFDADIKQCVPYDEWMLDNSSN
jgi:hypothetical protein